MLSGSTVPALPLCQLFSWRIRYISKQMRRAAEPRMSISMQAGQCSCSSTGCSDVSLAHVDAWFQGLACQTASHVAAAPAAPRCGERVQDLEDSEQVMRDGVKRADWRADRAGQGP
jgi:hypothetical protein